MNAFKVKLSGANVTLDPTAFETASVRALRLDGLELATKAALGVEAFVVLQAFKRPALKSTSRIICLNGIIIFPQRAHKEGDYFLRPDDYAHALRLTEKAPDCFHSEVEAFLARI